MKKGTHFTHKLSTKLTSWLGLQAEGDAGEVLVTNSHFWRL